jgi:hypothetical protein
MLTTVTPGHDFGNEIEIVSGLKQDDQVIINPPDSIISGNWKPAQTRILAVRGVSRSASLMHWNSR